MEKIKCYRTNLVLESFVLISATMNKKVTIVDVVIIYLLKVFNEVNFSRI